MMEIDTNLDHYMAEENDEMRILNRRAVSVRGACKKYGQKIIISNLNMTVPEGAIYALLGASGCGKTTLLACTVGIKKLDSGSIEVFGYEPGVPGSGVPGGRIGYMPQEIALFEEFSMREALNYFGQIYGMTLESIEERMIFLLEFLNLPNDYDRLIRNLSGGQQRRVSFAVALIHEPELLILDEPTVGVDPLLRKTIWEYLTKLSLTNKTTIIVTTHFIEEANESSRIGLMRNGRLIVEDNPTNLKQIHESDLEKIVLKLCIIDSDDNLSEAGVVEKTDQNFNDSNELYSKAKVPFEETSSSFTRLKALVSRNFIRMRRNFIYMAFLFVFPAAGVFFFCLAVGGKMLHLPFGLVNNEINGICGPVPPGCTIKDLSCKFLESIPEEEFSWKYFLEERDAVQSVTMGKTWGYLYIPKNFSENFPNSDDPKAGDKYKMRIRMDMTNHQIALSIHGSIYEAFQKFLKDWFADCFIDENFLEFPLLWDDPIFGDNMPSFTEYVAPSVHLVNILFMAVALTGEVFINEKKQGMFERSLVSGVTRNEAIFSHFISQYCVLIIQTFFALIILFGIFELPVRGSLVAVIVITMLQGTLGILMGFLFSTFCSQESTVLQVSIGTVMPNFVLAGIMWPVQGMPGFMQNLCMILPTTLAGESIRSIISRGWSVTHEKVWPGFVSNLAWIALLWIIIYSVNRFLIKKL